MLKLAPHVIEEGLGAEIHIGGVRPGLHQQVGNLFLTAFWRGGVGFLATQVHGPPVFAGLVHLMLHILLATAKISDKAIEHWWEELERLARILGRVGPDEMCCEGLTQRQCAILRTLVAREGSRLSDLAANAEISSSAMTRVIEKLEARGLVKRLRGSQLDGRAAVVRITPAGRRTRGLLDQLMRQRTAQIIASLPPRKRGELLGALETLNSAIESARFCGLNAPIERLVSQKTAMSRPHQRLGSQFG